MNHPSEHYLEDFAVGQTYGSGRLRIDNERTLAFAAEFDPQPLHLDENAASDNPDGANGSPQEIAKAALFLASDDSSFITGIELFVDGGRVQI
jgi:NAD(P)-dependent dehydrogenase (short-subunit alcohol dehydrogenase family)